ncbi:MAG: PHP domain-containing protein [Ruminococcaceae bacterium]|nr:PHP domain-containing protein [Oscillospiraceae bacterium]
MKRYLIPDTGSFYKANLHCHSTVSDGKRTPQEIKEIYMGKGYSVIAFTDHNVLVPHPDLRSDHFLPLNGFEADVTAEGAGPWDTKKTCHICFIAMDPENITMPFYHRSAYFGGNAVNYRQQVVFDESQPDYVREYSHAGVCDMMRRGREAGFFVTYNHPTWSRENYSEYMGYEGMHAMEIMNYDCWVGGYLEYNPRVYDDMLSAGKRIYAIAADDNHGWSDDECGAWTMIKAENLSYSAIMDALVKGHFYASWGPEIHALWTEGDTIHITCSPAQRIVVTYQTRRSYAIRGEGLTEAAFRLRPDDGYVRITVVDAEGRCADTNAYFMDDLLNSDE